MYVIKVNIYAEKPEYIIFYNENEIEEFIKNNIIMNNIDYCNSCTHKRYSLDDYMYVLREKYNLNDNEIKNQIKSSNEFNGYCKIKNVNKQYFKKLSFDYDYEIKVEIEYEENEEDEFDENIDKNKDDNENNENEENDEDEFDEYE